MPSYGSQEKVAAHLDMKVANLRILINKGVIDKPAKPGRYDLDKCRIAYIQHLRESAAGRGGDNELARHRSREAAGRADRIDMLNEKMRGNLVDRSDVINACQTVISNARGRLLQLPSRIAGVIDPEDDRYVIEAQIRELVNEALDELSRLDEVAEPTEERAKRPKAGSEGR